MAAGDPNNPTPSLQDIINLSNVSPAPAQSANVPPIPMANPEVPQPPTLTNTPLAPALAGPSSPQSLAGPQALAPSAPSESQAQSNAAATPSNNLKAPALPPTAPGSATGLAAPPPPPPSFMDKLKGAAKGVGEGVLGATGLGAFAPGANATPMQKGQAIMGLLGKIGNAGVMATGSPQQKEQAIQQQGQQNQLLQMQNEAAYRRGMLGIGQQKANTGQQKADTAQQTEEAKYAAADNAFGLPEGTARMMASAAQQRAATGEQVGEAKIGNLNQNTAKQQFELETLKNGQFPMDPVTANLINRPDLAGKAVSSQIWKQAQEVLNARGLKPTDLGPDGLWVLDRAGNRVNQISSISPSMARGLSYNQNRPTAVIDENGNARIVPAGEAERGNMAPAGLGSQVMSKQAQFKDINTGIGSLRSAINGISNQPLDPTTIAKLTMATRETDPTVAKQVIDTIAMQNLSPEQKDFVVAIGQLNERILSLRNLAGMGNGSDQMRAAIRQTLPSAKSGDVTMMRKQLDAVQNLVDNLHTGIPNISAVKTPNSSAPPTQSGKSVSLAAARQLPAMKGKSDAEITAAIKAQGHAVGQ